ncbi:MAG: T9SS type A sorting domain-containing protein [Limnohabitans sp.]|nr:T9SS type A sorting domain-containing protein [Limnohabitans sp.]
MKKIYSLLLLVIVNLSYSQDSRLFANFWYLTEVIQNGHSYVPPVDYMGVDFTTLLDPQKQIRGCWPMHANVTFGNNSTDFSMTNFIVCLCGPCSNYAAGNYQDGIFYPFFMYNGTSNLDLHAVNNFTYTITEVGSMKRLVVTSAYNAQAIFSDVRLANSNFEKLDFSFSPNPSNDVLEITLKNEFVDNVSVEFYNEIGQMCKNVDLNYQKSIVDIKDLPVGVYMVKIKADGEIATKRFVKI